MKRPAESDELDEVRAAGLKVVAEITATAAAIERVDQQVLAIEHKINLHAAKMEEVGETGVFPKGYPSLDHYMSFLQGREDKFSAKESQLGTKESQLGVEKD